MEGESIDTLDEKWERVRELVRQTGGLAVAFSGGADSTLVARAARDVLGHRSLAVTVLSPVQASWERSEATEVAAQLGIRHEIVELNVLEIPGFAENPPDRCYRCKREIFRLVWEVARPHGLGAVADGTHADDRHAHRPGLRALREWHVLSPLLEAHIGKAEVRMLSRRLGLSTAEKPPLACLATRFPYGTRITVEALRRIDALEKALREMGFQQVRVRYYGAMARIEVQPQEIERLTRPDLRERVVHAAHAAGFRYATVDLEGYRSGNLDDLSDARSVLEPSGD